MSKLTNGGTGVARLLTSTRPADRSTFKCGHPRAGNSTVYRDGYPRCAQCRRTRPQYDPQPAYHGPCLAGCGAPGGRRTGYCRPCNGLIAARWRRLNRTCHRVLGEPIPWAAVAHGLGESPEARRLAALVFRAVADGQLTVIPTARPTWLWPDRVVKIARLV